MKIFYKGNPFSGLNRLQLGHTVIKRLKMISYFENKETKDFKSCA